VRRASFGRRSNAPWTNPTAGTAARQNRFIGGIDPAVREADPLARAAYATAIFVTDLLTAVLLLAQFSILRSRALLAIASGYLYTALVPMARQIQPQIGRHNGPRKTKNAPAAIKAKPIA
jgi:hypothetical protein